jgi:hypothetical protein
MKECIFAEYFIAGKKCDKDYNCDECIVRDNLHIKITEILKKEESHVQDE